VVEAFGPVRSWVEPGAPFTVEAVLRTASPISVDIEVTLLDVAHEVDSVRADAVALMPGQATISLALELPPAPRHGYGLRLVVTTAAGATTEARAAVEALAGWWQSPRHAALTDFRRSADAVEAVGDLVAWNVTVMQHYDWMWRHYRYLPPDGATEFVDALGRTVSHDAVRHAVGAGHHHGIASLAYGSVYGAEAEHVERHPHERVFGEDGEPLSLGGTFFINDVRPASTWRERLLGEYEHAVEAFGFDGVHMDTYGPPHVAIGADGSMIDFASLYPGLIQEAAERLEDRAPGTRVLFNCVEGFPLESVAPTPMAAIYLELWPPDDGYADVVRWVDRARALAHGRAVVIAAYAAPLAAPVAPVDRPAALEAVYLLGSVIAAAGAYHHTLAERDRLLVEGYYPAAVPMTPGEATELRALWRYTARYVHVLSDPGTTVVERPDVDLVDDAGASVPWASTPRAGAVWLRETLVGDGTRALQLVDLRAQADATWTEPKLPAPPVPGLRLRWSVGGRLLAMSPWTADGDAVELHTASGTAELPSFRRWLTVLLS
jgi:dextranase